jgi:hypothetical protein
MRRSVIPCTLAALAIVGCATAAPEVVAPRTAPPISLLRLGDVLAEPPQPSSPGAERFTYDVVTAVGGVEFNAGDYIDILDVRGTEPTFKVGGVYRIAGRYRLNSVDYANLVVSATSYSKDPASGPTALGSVSVQRGFGDFVLELHLTGPGYPHITFYDPAGCPRSGVYFGEDGWLLPSKGWRYQGPCPERQPPPANERKVQLL